MNRKTLSFIFLAICVVLALLLVFNLIKLLLGALIFAVCLVVYGIVSNQMGRKN